MWLKACPRCRGDLIRQDDLDGPYVGCLQCGHVLRPSEEQRLVGALATVKGNAARAGLAGPYSQGRAGSALSSPAARLTGRLENGPESARATCLTQPVARKPGQQLRTRAQHRPQAYYVLKHEQGIDRIHVIVALGVRTRKVQRFRRQRALIAG